MLGDTYFCCHLDWVWGRGKKENDAIPTSGHILFCSDSVGSSLYNNTFYACGLRFVQSKDFYCSIGRNWMDELTFHIENAGRFPWTAIYHLQFCSIYTNTKKFDLHIPLLAPLLISLQNRSLLITSPLLQSSFQLCHPSIRPSNAPKLAIEKNNNSYVTTITQIQPTKTLPHHCTTSRASPRHVTITTSIIIITTHKPPSPSPSPPNRIFSARARREIPGQP